MQRLNIPTRTAGLAISSAMAIALLSGCAGQNTLASSKAPADHGLSDADSDSAVAKAEKRVARSPDSASARTELAQAYLSAGRFDSAATTFEDVVALGGDNARVGLGMALAYIGSGRNAEAFSVLGRWRDEIPASDFGLALALSGQPAMGVAVLTDAARGNDADAKTRQNLAYAYALNGQWTQARLIASQDVPADQLEARLGEWAATARPDASRGRIAGLLGAPLRSDPGQPTALALNGGDQSARLARADIPAPTFGQPTAAELPPVSADAAAQDEAPVAAPAPAAALAVAAPEMEPAPANAFIAKPVIQKVPKSDNALQASVDRMSTEKIASAAKPAAAGANHLVQLGSFQSREGAERAWSIFVKRDPSLKNHTMRVTEAMVNGRHYYRVSAEGFDRTAARSLCSTVRSRGDGCFAYAEQNPLPGAVPSRGAVGGALRAR
jgi:Flp pilus assembly protein TadD